MKHTASPYRTVRAVLSLVLALVFLTGCTTTRMLTSAELDQIKVGDRVVCTLKNGVRSEFKVAALESTAIIADNGQRVARTEIEHLEVKRTDTTKSVLVGVGVVAAIVIAVAAGGGGGGGGGY